MKRRVVPSVASRWGSRMIANALFVALVSPLWILAYIVLRDWSRFERLFSQIQ